MYSTKSDQQDCYSVNVRTTPYANQILSFSEELYISVYISGANSAVVMARDK